MLPAWMRPILPAPKTAMSSMTFPFRRIVCRACCVDNSGREGHSMAMIRLTAAQALVRYLAAQRCEWNGSEHPLFAGVWAIFGHGNVAALGEALHAARELLPTFRAHNEQAMGHAAIAFAKET